MACLWTGALERRGGLRRLPGATRRRSHAVHIDASPHYDEPVVESGVTPVHEAARRQGLGEVERFYRERNPLSEGPTYAIVTDTVAAVLAGAVPDTRWRVPVLLLGPVLGAGLVAAYVFLGKVSGVQRRRLIGVSPAGVLIHTEGGGSIALRWDQM